MRLGRIALLAALALSALGALGPASAVAAPVWNLDIHHHQTNFPPGGEAEYWLEVANVGDSTAKAGTVTLTLRLPGVFTRQLVRTETSWSCPGSPGDTTIVCTNTAPIERHSVNRAMSVVVDVSPVAAEGDRFAIAEVSGGGAAQAATAFERTPIRTEPAGFGILPESFKADFYDADGSTPVRTAGAHPDLATFAFDFNSISAPVDVSGTIQTHRKAEAGTIRDLRVDLPPGFLGNPTAVGECTPAELSFDKCPHSSQVGRIELYVYPIGTSNYQAPSVAVFNMVHPRGTITDLAFTYASIPVHIKANLDPANHYAISTRVSNINETLPPYSQKLTLWGVPADHSHDSERCGDPAETELECPTDAKPKPFLTVPFQCGVDNTVRLFEYDSWQNPGVFGPEIDYHQPGQSTDCDKPRFEPDVEVEPTGHQAETPTGLDVRIKVPQNENPVSLGTPPVKRTTVTLPEGMSFSPSFADGLESCALGQMKLGTNEPIACPDASRIGEVTLNTPLLPGPLEGSMYLAAQGDNPFGSLFALYLVLHDTEERGVLLKVPGKISVDPVTGQITTTFDETPQFPFETLALQFRSGPRAPLINPPSCGTHRIGVEMASWAQPNDPIDVSNTYQVSEGPNGTPCPPDSAHRPFAPKVAAGTLNPSAGTYSPFVFRLSRDDSEQELSQVTTVLPPGLTAKLAGITPCPDSVIASISSEEGTAKGEAANPACPANSRIGTLSAGLGAGPGPDYFPGSVYLAGPYHGAPLSLAIVTPGIAGPFDLGNVVVRVAIQVDRTTAQVTAVSDPFPTILHGVLLRVRDVRLRFDRPETMLNPTSCAQFKVGAAISGIGGNLLSTADDSLSQAEIPFQVANCAALGFAPKLALHLFGGTERGAYPRLRATLRMPHGNANIAAASVALPHSEFLAQEHIKTICTRVQFAADQCPADSVYGHAVAKTPLFSTPLEGAVYLRSSSHELPDMVAKLKGPDAQPIEVDLVGRVDSVRGGLRNSFEVVPDAPVETFTLQLQGGKKGLLVNSRNLCKSPSRATAKFTAHNGKVSVSRPIMQNACKKPRARAGKGRSGRPAGLTRRLRPLF
jgi:hypothetical protein